MDRPTIRAATPSDRVDLRAAVVELQEHERRLSATRLPGDAMADAYLEWMLDRVETASGAVLVVEVDGVFAGFAAGWVEEDESLAETPELQPLRARLGPLRPAGLSRPGRGAASPPGARGASRALRRRAHPRRGARGELGGAGGL